MNRSQFGSAFALALGVGTAVYFFATEHGRRTGLASADWLRAHSPDVAPQLGRIERQIDQLGTELRQRLDLLQQQVQPSVEVAWNVTPGDLDADLRDLPRGR